MAEQSGFFNANVVNGEYDRVYLAEHFAKYFASFIGNGVFGGKSNELMVSQATDTGMKIEVLSGMAWINGFWYENTSNLSLDISVADGVLNRIDNIVVKFGKSERKVWIEVVKGAPASVAVAPAVQRNSDYYELKLAEVYVAAGSTGITQAEIKDTRLDSKVCGFVVGLIKQFDTTEFGKQIDSFIKQFKETNVEEVQKLIDEIKSHLSEDTASNLMLELEETKDEVSLLNQTFGYTKKNLLPYPYNTYPGMISLRNGIEWFDNGDGTITALGTANEFNSYYTLYEGEFPKWLMPGKYLISAGNEHSESCYVFFVKIKKGTTNEYLGRVRSLENTEIVITDEDRENYNILISAFVEAGKTVSRVTLKPMIRKAEISDGTWEPFRHSVDELCHEDEAEKGCFYRFNNATKIKEWINPPLKYGVEYCTVERWNNKPVYQTTFYLSVLPNKTVASLSTGTQWDRVVSINAYALDSDDLTYYPFPVILQGQVTPIAVISKIESDGSLAITTNVDASHLKAYVTVKYTKS